MTTSTAPTPDLSVRSVPPLGGFSLTVLGLELRRMLRNRRTVVFTLVLPVVFFVLFGLDRKYATLNAGNGNVSAYIMISMAVYGAILATTSGGAMVSIERAAGWSRQLRLTPLAPVSYIAIKLLTAMTLGLASVLAVYAVGIIVHKPSMPVHLWIITALIAWLGSIVFAAFGLFMGYLLPSENVMQILGPVLALFAFGGGLFIPLDQMSSTFQTIAKLTPIYGLSGLVHVPLTGGSVEAGWIVNIVAWLAIFTTGAVWRFRKDTARV